MLLRRLIALCLWIVALAIGVALVGAAANIRAPALSPWRPWPIVAILVVSLGFAAGAWRVTRGRMFAPRVAVVSLALIAAGVGAFLEARIARIEASVLGAPPEELRAVARHLIVGYVDFAELRPLVARAGVAGVFVARRNARGKDEPTLAAEIQRIRVMRRDAGLPPVWIATDQEGGIVSALSPPLREPPPLSSLVHSGDLVVNEAEMVARDLACVGVNLNFAPVVDRDHRIVDPRDRHTRISRRAISADGRLVALAARDYCRALADSGVQCTAKHFPGIGGAKGDSHTGKSTLADLAEEDLLPFRELASEEPPWIMVSHATIESLDPGAPASASLKALGLLRDDWGFKGVIVTDDASMAAFASDFDRNVVAALRNGVDILLVTWNPDLVYEALDALLRARRADPAFSRALAESDERLAKRAPTTPVCSRLARR